MSDEDAATLVSIVETMWRAMETNYNAFRMTREIDTAWANVQRLKAKLPAPPPVGDPVD